MLIILKKLLTKPSILSITRNDNSTTWSKLHKGLETHDLAHYAVESCLKFKHAFYGIINQGYQISDFELPKNKRPFAVRPENLHQEAIVTEHIVNLLEVELLNSGLNTHFIKVLKLILKNNSLYFPKGLTPNKLDEIRGIYHNLYNQWMSLNNNEELTINFKP